MKRITLQVLLVILILLCFGSIQYTKANNKPNLYILSIGATPPDIKYTVEDADDIVEVFNEQKEIDNSLYSEIITMKLSGKEATSNAILKYIKKMIHIEDISPNDVFILFIASHGYRKGGKFYIQGSDFDTTIPLRTSVSLGDIMECLNKLDAKKLIFLDACESVDSGVPVPLELGRKGTLIDYVNKIKKAKSGYAVITSSSGDSHWHKAWQNGAFTEMLIKGLNDGEADYNSDKIITLGEIYEYLQKEVPQLCKNQGVPLQHPDCIRYDYKNDLPFYSVNPDNVEEEQKQEKLQDQGARDVQLKGVATYQSYSIHVQDDKLNDIFRWEQASIPLFYDNDRYGNRYFEASAAFMGEHKRLGLRLDIKIDGDALPRYGTFGENNPLIIHLDNNKQIILYCYQYMATYDYDTEQTKYSMAFNILPEDKKRLHRNTITDVVIGWTPGKVKYQVIQPDGLIRQLNNIKRAKDDGLIKRRKK